MAGRRMITVDGNEAAASVAHRVSEVIAIYPITPSSPMGEFSDEWTAKGKRNVWGVLPDVVEMQSEAGAAGAIHGALQAGALSTSFTASQGLLLFIPNMYKIAGELNPFVLHVTARTLATHALSIFGDHSDVMSVRSTGFGLIASCSVQEVHDMAAISHAATLTSRVPMLHFFDGFRTSHEVNKVEELTNDDLLAMLDEQAIAAHRERALSPDRPKLRGTAQNPDVYFQAREACNPYYDACADHVQRAMDRFAGLTGRSYHLFDYVGHPEADRVLVAIGSSTLVIEETIRVLAERGEKVGLLNVRLYRPFSLNAFIAALPRSVKVLGVLDRCKEPGAPGDPLYLDVVTALAEAMGQGLLPAMPRVLGGRYGLSSKEFTPAMVAGIYAHLARPDAWNHFTVGIDDDVTHLSIPYDPSFDTEKGGVVRALFFGLGADGTVGANKNSIKIIAEDTPNYAQGYFVYDSKKSGTVTTSHLRFGPNPVISPYLINRASFVACHQFQFIDKLDMLAYATPGAVFLLNAPYGPDEIWDHLPLELQQSILDKGIRFFVIDGYRVARENGMGTRTNTIMQTCFFAISGVLPREQAIGHIKETIRKTYLKKGEEIVARNFRAVDDTLANLHEVAYPKHVTATYSRPGVVAPGAPEFVKRVTAPILAGYGDSLPVSAFAADGTWPVATTQWEKRNIAQEIPIWDPSLCIQCNKCALICPHAALRPKVFDPAALANAPEAFRSVDYKAKDFRGMKYTMQVAPEDCTGCTLCVVTCPSRDKANPGRKALTMERQLPIRDRERENYAFFLGLPDIDRDRLGKIDVKSSQFLRPLFEYSGACAGCGETPYVKLLTQLFGDRAIIANATGCSSIYGGNLPTTPYAVNEDGRGPSWSNSLFEDAAEFGFGFRLAVDQNKAQATELLRRLGSKVGADFVEEIVKADMSGEAGLKAQRARVAELRRRLEGVGGWEAARLRDMADYLVKKSIWMLGGDGWAYDIGFGGLDHVVANNRDVNLLVMDTEVYSNTGGQQSKATPIGAAAKFAAAGKEIGKKDLGLIAMSYRTAYVASVAIGAKDAQTVRAFMEADSYPGPSIIIAYSHCIAHGYDLVRGPDQQKRAVDMGLWPLFRYDPRRIAEGLPPLQLDSPEELSGDIFEYMKVEARFKQVEQLDKARFERLGQVARNYIADRMALYRHMATLTIRK